MTERHFIGTARSSALLYGKGVFTTIAVFDGSPFLWEKHWQRLVDGAAKIGLDLSELSKEAVHETLSFEISGHGIIDGRARITFYDRTEGPHWSKSEISGTEIVILMAPERNTKHDLKLTVSPFSVNSKSPLAGIKSCNYLENILAMNQAKTRGFHEAVRVNERGEITSGCMSNFFWLRDGRLFTPALSTGCLAGTTREHVIENTECEEVVAKIEALKSAEAIFLTSAGLGIAAVAEFDGRKFDRVEFPVSHLWPRP